MNELTLQVMNDGDDRLAEVLLDGRPLLGIVLRPETIEVLAWPDGEQNENLMVVDREQFERTIPPYEDSRIREAKLAELAGLEISYDQARRLRDRVHIAERINELRDDLGLPDVEMGR